ncbi:RHS repeat-associated protein [Pedobacter sp. AK013]|uniref:RHS repeat-associated core domain-containing protein n=1 Tax=Pedobacter sp. AK013 TaxID=2723071 RepID=UPI0017CBEEA4|nr:RHS repeat-associated protein [Pedobacter sp. AK013]
MGNVRVTFYKNPTIGQLEVLQRDDYYAFGLRKEPVIKAGTNKYLYNGKELQEELNEYDYRARFYDPVIGRWNVVDPLSEDFDNVSPYNYGLNNPIRFIDPNGMSTEDFMKEHGLTSDDVENVYKAPGEQDTEEEQEIEEGRNAVNVPGTIIRKTKDGYTLNQVTKGNIATNQVLDKWMNYGMSLSGVGRSVLILKAVMSEEGDPEDLLGISLSMQQRSAANFKFNIPVQFTVNPSKFEYFFGKVVSGNTDNIKRSAQNLKDLTTLGITSERQLKSVFSQAFNMHQPQL